MAESVVEDLDPDLVRLGRVDRDFLNRDGLASLPRDGSLASDNLRHSVSVHWGPSTGRSYAPCDEKADCERGREMPQRADDAGLCVGAGERRIAYLSLGVRHCSDRYAEQRESKSKNSDNDITSSVSLSFPLFASTRTSAHAHIADPLSRLL